MDIFINRHLFTSLYFSSSFLASNMAGCNGKVMNYAGTLLSSANPYCEKIYNKQTQKVEDFFLRRLHLLIQTGLHRFKCKEGAHFFEKRYTAGQLV